MWRGFLGGEVVHRADWTILGEGFWMRRSLAYLVSPSIEAGVVEARGRGWTQIARGRFVVEDGGGEVRVVSRFADLLPQPGVMRLMRGAGYEDGEGAVSLERWIKEKGEFDRYVEAGLGEWVSP
jgi:hypothetical protein